MGEIIGLSKIARDITDQKMAEVSKMTLLLLTFGRHDKNFCCIQLLF